MSSHIPEKCHICEEYHCLAGCVPAEKCFKKKRDKEISQRVCLRCGRKGDFRLLGAGFIKCGGCGALHIVSASGQLHPAHFLKPYERVLQEEEVTSEMIENRRKWALEED